MFTLLHNVLGNCYTNVVRCHAAKCLKVTSVPVMQQCVYIQVEMWQTDKHGCSYNVFLLTLEHEEHQIMDCGCRIMDDSMKRQSCNNILWLLGNVKCKTAFHTVKQRN
jgi:hypothetical protein